MPINKEKYKKLKKGESLEFRPYLKKNYIYYSETKLLEYGKIN
jgi:hypothetical protein